MVCLPEVKLWCTMVLIFMCTPLLQGQREELIDTASNVISEEEEASALKTRAQELGEVLRRRLMWLRRPRGKDSRLDLIFLVDASSSVGPDNFASELRFVRKLLADLEVSAGATRVALVTFASSAERHVDTVSDSSDTPRHKCDILERALPAVNYSGGATFTLGAMLEAQAILKNARPGSRRAVFLLTDGYSNGGDPLPAARALREELGATVFTFGVRSGNTRELADMASKPAHEHAFLLPSFEQFAALARRALHQDLRSGARLEVQDDAACAAVLCSHGSEDCGCAEGASCVCDTLTGRSQCVCPAGFQGSGLRADCQQCPTGTYAETQRVLRSLNTSLAELQYSSKCSPCPDPAHESPPGSTSVSQCRCREGFVASDNLNCKVLECPVLQPPSRGSFVGGPCAQVFNAACGVTCATGHRLVGSSIRLCRADGSWSGQAPRCARRECPPLEAPRFGWVRCSGRSKDEKKTRAVDATCEVGCESPYALLGSRTRTCLALGAWDGLPSTCKAVTCAAVPIPRRAIISPDSCVARTKQPAGHECRFTCREQGFGLRGAEVRRCGENGRWSGTKPRCVDIQPPELICPRDVTIHTLLDEDVAELNVSWPNITDNSGGAVRLRISPPVILTGGRLGIGRQRITLRATDPAGNFAICRFVVTVRDKQAPDVTGCESPPVFLTAADEAPNVTWSEPTFSDNSGQEPKINCTHQQGASFKRGVTEVRYEARDEAGNVASCVININVEGLQCETPLHGYCLEDERGACSLVCDEGYAFALAPDPDVTCNPTSHDSPFPDCSVMTLPNSFSQHVSADLTQDEIQDDCNLLANSIEAEISNAVSQACTGVECHLQRVSDPCAQEEFVTQSPSEDEENNVVTRRKRRRASRNRVYTEYKIRAQNSSHSITFRLVGQLRVPGTGPSGVRVTLGIVKALLTTTNAGGNARNFSQKLPALRIRLDPAELGCPAGSVLRATDICVQCPRGTFLKPGAKECFLCGVGFFQPKSGEQACLPCPKGTSTKPGTLSTKRQHCRPLCKPGTKSRDGVTPCSPCPLGTFQPLSGQRACTPCPANMTTQRRGATDKQFCKIPCAAGSVSRSGLAPCLLCPTGYSQPRTGQKVCEPGASICALSGICPPPLHASHPCLRSPCHVSSICLPLHPRQSRHFRCHCSPGRTGTFCEEEIRDVCASLPCDNGGTCIPGNNDALSSCDCLPACESDSCEESNVTTSCTGESCERNSNLLSEEKDTTSCSSCLKANFTCNCTAGFSGLLCEEDIDECAEMPCGEFGLCTDLPDEGFICDCAPGYGGTQCEMIESACSALEPCVTGVCLDEPGASFHCECPATRGGVRCEEIRDPCEAKGCLNGATCVPEPWPEEEIGQLPNASCVCLSGYHGERCEKLDTLAPHNACSSSPCLNGGTCRAGVSSELPGGYTCTCTGGFAGETCNISLPKDAVLRFPGGGSLGYVLRENALSRPLQELTLCSWLRTADTLNYGTPVSYATPQQDNTLALTDYSGFVVYVNGERAVTDVAVNDGAWHLVCLLWASRPRGAWRLYKDGILSDQGEGLANNTQIPGGGTLVLGQEQDSPGGSFSSAQSFLGRLGPTALWPTLLSPSRLRAMFERCGDDETIADLAGVNASEEEAITAGDAVALWSWKDALSGIRGKLQLESSEFCAGCTPPLTPPYGLVNVSGVGAAAVATFSCQPGFRPVGARRAECGKRGTWQTDSPQPPTCQRLSCGKPTAHINSKLQGSGFEFESKLRIVCLTGFVLPSNAIEFIECLSSGKWSPLPPPCVEARCSLKNLSKIANGTWQHLRGSGEELGESTKATDARFAEQVELVCETGLAPRGASLFTCLDGGHWDTNDESLCVHPACVKSPPRLQHARIPLVSGVKARYSCFPNYTMQGSPLVTCVEGWRPLPTCVPVSTIVRCPAAPRVENSNLSLDSGTARYVCADGFTLEGEAEIRCSKTGTWPPAPVCQAVAKCLTAPELEHGTVTVVNDVANLVCNTDYFLVGAAELRCEGSSWIGEAKCHLLGCLPPKPVEHGTVNVARGRGAGPQVLKGAIAEYKCASGYQLVGPRARKCLSHKQQWSSVEPYCKPVAT